MRVGSMQMTIRYQNQLYRTYHEQEKLMEQSDGSKLHRPSDDAVAYSKYLRYNVSLSENNQYQTNTKTAVSWMKNSDAALVNIKDCFATIVEKSNQAQDTNTTTDMKAISQEMLVLVQEAVSDANAQVGDRYVFSGQKDLVQPFSMSTATYQRGIAKTLDDKQTEFFNDCDDSNGSISQMLTLKGSDGEEYYLNTLTGKVYSKEFMDDGYKEKLAAGQTHVAAGDEVGTITMAKGDVAKYFDNKGVINGTGKAFNPSITVDGKTVNLSFKFIEQRIVTYNGDRKHFSMVKENGAEQPASDEVNANGVDIAGTSIFDDPNSGNESSGAACFNDNLTVVAMCATGDARWMSSDGKTLANNAFNTINNAESNLGARQQVYTASQSMLTTMNEAITGDITDVASTDVAKLAVEMMQAQTVYNLSLFVGSRIIPPTLADYL